ncbi:sodium channel regulatory subunit beta-1 isoform X1 [Paramormyrops kingsleyae]|uniref:Sodium channel regulatory subunit beta-3 n=1 Tax=Paramormyrops kingsleyae TaxID=1676925 RepID=A0A3B3RHZ5_9TELE|nr:sodium channel subunit beta-1-like [Paramormyrops kingsleyae]
MISKMLPFLCFLLHIFYVPECQGGCAEVDSMTEAPVGQTFLLGCISCKRREEVEATTTVDWYFRPLGEEEYGHILHYDFPTATITSDHFKYRLEWFAPVKTSDTLVASLYLHNVTFNDTGTYRCTFDRILHLPVGDESFRITKYIEFTVLPKAKREKTAVIGEIMMYVLIVGLQLWLIVVLIYCYRKVSAEREAYEARQALKALKKQQADLKDNCDGINLE